MSAAISSSSANPDLDWSQLKETIVMLNLAIAQIKQSMHEGNSSVDTLAHSFTTLASNLSDIQNTISEQNIDHESLNNLVHDSSEKVHSAIVAFQFYDKLSQRLDHVSHSLDSLTGLIADPSALYSPPHWQALQESIRSKYTMEEERQLFDKVLSGMPIDEALEEFNQVMAQNNKEDDIELF